MPFLLLRLSTLLVVSSSTLKGVVGQQYSSPNCPHPCGWNISPLCLEKLGLVPDDWNHRRSLATNTTVATMASMNDTDIDHEFFLQAKRKFSRHRPAYKYTVTRNNHSSSYENRIHQIVANNYNEAFRTKYVNSTNLRGAGTTTEDTKINVQKVDAHSDRQLQVYSNVNTFVNENPTLFHLKMNWEPGHCWQEEWEERHWCMACADTTCKEGDILWLQECNQYERNQRFEWVTRQTLQDGTSLRENEPQNRNPFRNDNITMQYGMLKVACQDLCYQRIRINAFELRKCNYSSPEQILVRKDDTQPISEDVPFEIYPYERYDKCLNQHHHPKPDEFIFLTMCDTARHYDTSFWKMTFVEYQSTDCSRPSLRERQPECSSRRKCGVCTGDCDRDGHCADGLRCMQRNGLQPIPGCSGSGVSGRDYCYDPSSVGITTPRPPTPGPPTPGQPPIPKRPPTAGPPTPRPPFGGTGDNNGNDLDLNIRYPTCSEYEKCDLCQGDCDNDNQCKDDMICFQRSSNEAVPGCNERGGIPRVDYCISPTTNDNDDNNNNNVLTDRAQECSTRAQCGECQGDCDVDGDCEFGLKCYRRNRYGRVPGCSGMGTSGRDYCYKPQNLYNRSPECSSRFPCGECQGDCDNDNDCEGSLRCLQRRNYERVPGCSGWGTAGRDYCYNPF